jgi:hypothetical protein
MVVFVFVFVVVFAIVRPPPSISSSSPDIVRLPSATTTAGDDMDRSTSSRHSAGDFLASTARSRRLGGGGGGDVDVVIGPFLSPSPRVLPPFASSAVRRAVDVDVDVGRGSVRRGNEVAMIVVVEGGGERKKACAIVEGAWRCARKHAVATTTRVVDAEDGIGPCWCRQIIMGVDGAEAGPTEMRMRERNPSA